MANDDRTELMDRAIEQARQLVKTEMALARRELGALIDDMTQGAALVGGAGVLALAGLTGLIVSAGLSMDGRGARGPLLLSTLAIAAAGALAYLGKRQLPEHPLRRMTLQFAQDAGQLKH
jgi:hypothetical protein